MTKNFFLLFLASISTVFYLLVSSHSIPTSFTTYNEYVLSVSWPGDTCLTNQCAKQFMGTYKGATWNLHGLWPGGPVCQEVFDCNATPYDFSSLTPTIQEGLNQYWVGLYSSSDEFRQHEWEKHGTCWNEKLKRMKKQILEDGNTNQNAYFQKVLELNQKYNIFASLAENGIWPGSNFPLSDFRSIMEEKFGFKQESMGVNCQLINGTQYITQVRLCLDLNYNPKICGCPSNVYSSCRGNNNINYSPFVLPQNLQI